MRRAIEERTESETEANRVTQSLAAMAFALRAGDESNLVLFALAVGVTAVLVILERLALWVIGRYKVR